MNHEITNPIFKLQRLRRWGLKMAKKFHRTLFNGYNYFFMIVLETNHVS